MGLLIEELPTQVMSETEEQVGEGGGLGDLVRKIFFSLPLPSLMLSH